MNETHAGAITHILFPFDFSAQGLLAVPFVRALASQFQASVTVLSVVPPTFEVMPAGMGVRAGEDVADWLLALKSRLDQALVTEFAGLPVERITDAGDPGFRIIDVAHSHGVDLIMMPTHGLGLYRNLLVGSATSKVLHDARCPVWTSAHAKQQRTGGLPRTILCALDGRPASVALLRWAGDFSTQVGAALTLLHVVPPITDWPSLASERALQEQVRQAAHATIVSLQAAAGVQAPLRVAVGDIVATVTEHAREEDADLILVGRGSLQSALGRLRTHAYGIIHRSPCPVLSV
jgi:nucleotide-binding universal stress UspA family protein